MAPCQGRRRKEKPWLLRFLVGLLAWLAGWELLAELYTMGRGSEEYIRLHRQARPPLPMSLFFWAGMGGLMAGGMLWMLGGRDDR